MEDIPVADIATHPFLTTTFSEAIEKSANFIHTDKEIDSHAFTDVGIY